MLESSPRSHAVPCSKIGYSLSTSMSFRQGGRGRDSSVYCRNTSVASSQFSHTSHIVTSHRQRVLLLQRRQTAAGSQPPAPTEISKDYRIAARGTLAIPSVLEAARNPCQGSVPFQAGCAGLRRMPFCPMSISCRMRSSARWRIRPRRRRATQWKRPVRGPHQGAFRAYAILGLPQNTQQGEVIAGGEESWLASWPTNEISKECET